MANLEKLKALHHHITTIPDGWNQEFWGEQRECGTAYCMAGWTCVLEGHQMKWKVVDAYESPFKEATQLVTGEDIDTKAAEILGLSEDYADRLFYCTDNASALRELENLIDSLEGNTAWRTSNV
jgi:hypothetical protein